MFHYWLKALIACCLYLGLTVTAYGNANPASKEINFENISVDKGLSSTSVYAITQTKDGFLWIGTQNGLNRYDGYNFKVFNFTPGDKTALSNNWVKALCTDKAGNLWVGTSSGLNRYHAETETFNSYFHHEPEKNSLADNNIWCIFEDRQGTIWVGTNNGLSRYNAAKDHFENYYIHQNIPGTRPNNSVNTIAEDKDGNFWIGTWGNGFFRFDKQKGTFKNFVDITFIQAAANQYVKTLKFDKKGKLWIGTQNNGLHTFDTTSKAYTIYRTDPANPHSISDNGILSILEDSRGEMWIGTYTGGMNHFHASDTTFSQYRTNFLKPQSLQGDWITSFFEDKGGNIWIGHDNGLSRFNPEGPKFLHYKYNPFEPNSIPNSNINVIFEDKQETIWIGTWGGGLCRFNKQTGKFIHYRTDSNNPTTLSDNRIWGICEDKDGALWVASSGGLHKFNRKTDSFLRFNDIHKDNPAVQINFMALSSMAADKHGKLWVGTWGDGLYMYDPVKDTTLHLVHNPEDINSLSNDRLKHVFVDSKNNVWLCTSEGGLDKLTFDANHKPIIQHFRYKASATYGIGSDSPQIVYEDSKGRLWVGTEGGGLSFWDERTNIFQRVLSRGSSFPGSVYGILEDEAGNLWMSTNNGIIHYNPVSGHVKGYDVTDGLQSNIFLSGHCQTRAGAMLFGGHNGFNLFFPVTIKESSFKPPVLLSELRIFNELIEVGKPHKNTYAGEEPVLQKPLFLCDEITLSYKDYVLSFSFTSMDFSAPHKNKFAYMLENFEDEWTFTDGNKRFATYTNLKPGEYIFKVKATNSDGIWNDQPASVKIIVTPPFWQTWWFRTLSFSILLLIAYIIHRTWVQVKLENLLAMERMKAQEAEALRKKVAMDFHDEMGNQLASITAIINLINIRQSKKEYQIEDLLNRLTQQAQSLFYGTKDFIWSIDPKSDKAEIILLNIKDFGDDLFDRTGISFHFFKDLPDPDITFPAGASRHITLLCKEVFTNIVKHANCQSVRVQAISTGNHLTISIKDDGCGFDMNGIKKNGFGLENMRTRAKKINAEITIDSKTSLGTEITLSILIPKKGEDKKRLVLDFSS